MQLRSAFIGLGSNLEDPAAQLDRALAALAARGDLRLDAVSSYYRTAPWGETAQPAFVNAAARLETALSPEALLDVLIAIESAAGRRRELRWGPRTLDLDLLLYGDARIDEPGLVVPHPRMHLRAFVLVPLAEVAPEAEVPGQGRVDALLAAVDASGVRPA